MRLPPRPRRALLFGALGIAVLALGAALVLGRHSPGKTYSVAPGPSAGHPRCADVLAAAPDSLLGKERDRTTGTGTAAWGDASIVLQCGVEPPPPTTDLCLDVDGVGWVLDEDRMNADGTRTVTTYGRSPAVAVTFHGREDAVGDALVDLNRSVEDIPQDGECLSAEDVPLAEG
ncbi:DUF3515 domain-containing protein [Streptomyces sp. JJ38]|uniref:DUF3515 domain-containing protein n=1 Tax=Streptomyces sp. JJ38 TaxID=2738128 RepID=UPI001C59E864|nr:DUF3515 domain-containing protein [Streptomyces sp. JJ38]MBW1599141.1 DUF3515 domain-containing protein [Streptomyces sp. JJ38]